jgi:hypothetical protein
MVGGGGEVLRGVTSVGSACEARSQFLKKSMLHGPYITYIYAGGDYNLTLCPLQSRLQHIYHAQPYARVDLNPMTEPTLSPSQGHWIWPQDIRVFFLINIVFKAGICYHWLTAPFFRYVTNNIKNNIIIRNKI